MAKKTTKKVPKKKPKKVSSKRNLLPTPSIESWQREQFGLPQSDGPSFGNFVP